MPYDKLHHGQIQQAHLDDNLRPAAGEPFLAHLPQRLAVSPDDQIVADREDRRVEDGRYRGNYLSYGHVFGHATLLRNRVDVANTVDFPRIPRTRAAAMGRITRSAFVTIPIRFGRIG